MKLMTIAKKYGSKVALVGSTAFAAMNASAAGELVTAATTELAGTKSDALAIGALIIGLTASIAVIGVILHLVRKGG